MNTPILHAPIDFERLPMVLKDLFGIDEITSHKFVHGGFMSQNFRLETPQGVFFFKEYRNRVSTVVYQIKLAEEYFSRHGLPIILPIKDRFGREVFWFDGRWFSLFPFIEGRSPEAEEINETTITSLASTLAQFHYAGQQFNEPTFQHIRIGDPRKLLMESAEIRYQLSKRPALSGIEKEILELLDRKEQISKRMHFAKDKLIQPHDCLLHGDFQYLNTFIDSSEQVSHVYDLERAALGPRSLEVTRALFLNCFDTGWSDKNFELAKTFLSVYKQTQPFSFEDLSCGVFLYAYNILHTTWIGARYVIFDVEMQMEMFERHARRVEFVSKPKNLRTFCERIFS